MHISWRIADSLLPTEMKVCGCVDMCVLVSYIYMYVHVKGNNSINWRQLWSQKTHMLLFVSFNCRLTELPQFQAKPYQVKISFA